VRSLGDYAVYLEDGIKQVFFYVSLSIFGSTVSLDFKYFVSVYLYIQTLCFPSGLPRRLLLGITFH